MPEPINQQGPLPADVVKRVSDFLLKPVKNVDGGWTEVTHDDWTELVQIFEDIIDAKFERDADGDHTIEFETCHRKQGQMQSVHIPYFLDTSKDMLRAVNAIRTASGIVEDMTRRMHFKISDEIKQKSRIEKMEPVLLFCATNARERAFDRVKAYVAGESNLYVGHDDGAWAPLGLTCAEIRQTQRDNYGPRYHDAVDALFLNAVETMKKREKEYKYD